MKIHLIDVDVEIGHWFWVSILNIQIGDQDRSMLHIERNGGAWKFEFLFRHYD